MSDTFQRTTQPLVAEVAIVIFFRSSGVQRRKEKVTAVYLDGDLLEYGTQHSGDMDGYVDGFMEGISYGRKDGSIKFVRGTAKLLSEQEPPMSLSNVVRSKVDWEEEIIGGKQDDEGEEEL